MGYTRSIVDIRDPTRVPDSIVDIRDSRLIHVPPRKSQALLPRPKDHQMQDQDQVEFSVVLPGS